MTDKKALDAVIKARTVLIVTSPFFGCLALHLDLQEIEDPAKYGGCETMAVDGYTMFYYPKFVLSLKDPELVAVVAHETMHCVYRHMTRRGTRHPKVYNWAGDYRINWDLKQAGFQLPGQPIPWDPKRGSKDTHGHLLDPQFADMSSEEIYEKIYREVPKIKIGGMFGSGNDPAGGMGEVMDAGSGDGDKKGKGARDAAAQAAERDWEANIRVALNAAQRAGTLPGYLERLVEQLKEPRVSWRDLTRQFIDNSMIKDHSWQRPNRRFVGQGMYLPGMISDALHKLVMVIDCSGSISEEMLHTYVSEVGGALDQGTTDELVVVYADTEVRHVDTFVSGDVVKAKVIAGGGTDFKDSFKWIVKNAPDAQAIVYLTDMMTCDFGEDPNIATMWCAYASRATLAQYKPSFGTVIVVDTEG